MKEESSIIGHDESLLPDTTKKAPYQNQVLDDSLFQYESLEEEGEQLSKGVEDHLLQEGDDKLVHTIAKDETQEPSVTQSVKNGTVRKVVVKPQKLPEIIGSPRGLVPAAKDFKDN